MAGFVFIRKISCLIKLFDIFVMLVLDFATAPSEETLGAIGLDYGVSYAMNFWDIFFELRRVKRNFRFKSFD